MSVNIMCGSKTITYNAILLPNLETMRRKIELFFLGTMTRIINLSFYQLQYEIFDYP